VRAGRVGGMLAGLQSSLTAGCSEDGAGWRARAERQRQACGCWRAPGCWTRRGRESCARLSRVSTSPDRQGGNVCRCDAVQGSLSLASTQQEHVKGVTHVAVGFGQRRHLLSCQGSAVTSGGTKRWAGATLSARQHPRSRRIMKLPRYGLLHSDRTSTPSASLAYCQGFVEGVGA
jgi:hypothetical protein